MRSGFRLPILLLVLAACSVGYFYYAKGQKSGTTAAMNRPHPERVPTTDEEKLARRLVSDNDFAAVDQALDQSRKDDARTSEGISRLGALYEAIGEELTDLEKYKHIQAVMKLFDDWKKANPDSQGRRVALAGFYKDAAWRARGSDVASTVRSDQWQTFEALLTKSFELLDEARRAEPYDPHVTSLMLNVGMAAGMPKATALETMDELMEKYPTYDRAYRSMVVYLLPRWQGEPGDLEAFMKTVRQRLPQPQGDILYATMSSTAFLYIGNKFFLETDLKYDELKPAYETVFRTYPEDMSNRRTFAAIAAAADDRAMTRQLLQETTGTWTPEKIQANFRAPQTFDQVQAWANDQADNPVFLTPLEIAFEQKDPKAVQAAIRDGADLNRHFSSGTTPLILALSERQHALAKYLMEQGASTTATTRNGYTVAAAAVHGDNVELLQKFLASGLKPTDEVNGAHYTILHVAAYTNSVECMKAILKLPGVDVNAKLPNGQTPLFQAAMADSADCAKLLLDAGADANAKQTNLITPVHQAAYSGSPEVLKLLLERGGDPDAASDCNVKPIEEARRNHQEETERILAAALKKK